MALVGEKYLHSTYWEPMRRYFHKGISVFYKDESGTVFHTYSCYARGIDMMNGTYHYLDLVPKGRDEEGLEGPQDWVQYHDRYED